MIFSRNFYNLKFKDARLGLSLDSCHGGAYRNKLVFFGTSEFAAPSLQALLDSPKHHVLAVFTQPDRPKGRNYLSSSSPVKKIAQDFKIPVHDGNFSDISSLLHSLQPDLGITISFGRILPKDILTIPCLGFINVHASLLPKYRGASPIQEALLHGDDVTGISILQMVPELDRGPLIAQQTLPIDSFDTACSLFEKLSRVSSNFLLHTLTKILNGDIILTPQDESKASLSRKISRDDGCIDWHTMTKEHIIRMFRAFDPWPGIYTFFRGKRLKILDIDFVPQTSDHYFQGNITPQSPGKVFLGNQNTIFISTQNGVLSLRKVQLEGKKTLEISDFIRGYPDFLGSFLGKR